MEMSILHREILALCVDDYTAFGLIVKRVAYAAYNLETLPDRTRKKVMAVLGDLLRDGLIVAGQIGSTDNPGFSNLFSPEKFDDAISYIGERWDVLGRTPNIGDICWFNSTPEGDKYAIEHNIDISESMNFS